MLFNVSCSRCLDDGRVTERPKGARWIFNQTRWLILTAKHRSACSGSPPVTRPAHGENESELNEGPCAGFTLSMLCPAESSFPSKPPG